MGIISADATVNVYVDGAKATSFAVTVAGQEIKKVTKPDVFDGLAEGSHAVKVEVVCDKDNNAANNVVEKTVVVLGSPVAQIRSSDVSDIRSIVRSSTSSQFSFLLLKQ